MLGWSLASAPGAAATPAAVNRVRDRRQRQPADSAAVAGADHPATMGHFTLSDGFTAGIGVTGCCLSVAETVSVPAPDFLARNAPSDYGMKRTL